MCLNILFNIHNSIIPKKLLSWNKYHITKTSFRNFETLNKRKYLNTLNKIFSGIFCAKSTLRNLIFYEKYPEFILNIQKVKFTNLIQAI